MSLLPFPYKFRSILLATLVCLTLAAGLIGWGYWQGIIHPKKTAETENKMARFNSPPPTIPADSTPEMREFLNNQFTLTQKMEQLRGQGPNGTVSPQAFAQFRKDNADLIKRQSDLSQILAQQQNKNVPSGPPPQIPTKASPQLQAYLAARDQLMRDQVAFMNQHRTDDLATQQAAMRQWRQQNEPRFQQLQQLAQALPSRETSPK